MKRLLHVKVWCILKFLDKKSKFWDFFKNFQSQEISHLKFQDFRGLSRWYGNPEIEVIQTWLARSWYCFFSSGFSAYHHSPSILLTDRLSWFGCRWWTRVRCRLLKIMKAFIGRRTWSRKPSLAYHAHQPQFIVLNQSSHIAKPSNQWGMFLWNHTHTNRHTVSVATFQVMLM